MSGAQKPYPRELKRAYHVHDVAARLSMVPEDFISTCKKRKIKLCIRAPQDGLVAAVGAASHYNTRLSSLKALPIITLEDVRFLGVWATDLDELRNFSEVYKKEFEYAYVGESLQETRPAMLAKGNKLDFLFGSSSTDFLFGCFSHLKQTDATRPRQTYQDEKQGIRLSTADLYIVEPELRALVMPVDLEAKRDGLPFSKLLCDLLALAMDIWLVMRLEGLKKPSASWVQRILIDEFSFKHYLAKSGNNFIQPAQTDDKTWVTDNLQKLICLAEALVSARDPRDGSVNPIQFGFSGNAAKAALQIAMPDKKRRKGGRPKKLAK